MRKIYLLIFLPFILGGCGINSSIMFQTPKDFPYYNGQTIGNIEYKIAPNDILGFSVFTNKGFKLIDLTTNANSISTGGGGVGNSSSSNKFIVDIDGYVKLPIIDRVKIQGFTIREAEKMLEQKYSTYYNDPFITLSVDNRRVMVFPGDGGAGRVVILTNENTSLIEALALAGGISTNGKAASIKLIRGDYRNPQVQIIDLSTVEGMKQSNLLLQANDIIYVEPRKRISQGVFAEITPIVGILTSLLLIYNIIITNKNN